MIELSVMYPEQKDKRFNLDYYLNDHFRLVQRTWGKLIKDAYITKGVSSVAEGAPPLYRVTAHLRFGSLEDLGEALAQGAEIFADIPNFTDIQPVVQANEVLAGNG